MFCIFDVQNSECGPLFFLLVFFFLLSELRCWSMLCIFYSPEGGVTKTKLERYLTIFDKGPVCSGRVLAGEGGVQLWMWKMSVKDGG